MIKPNATMASTPLSPYFTGRGSGEGQPLAPTLVAAPHPNPLPTEEWGEGTDVEAAR